MHFNSMFTRTDSSSLIVLQTKFNGPEVGMLRQLVVTPEVVDCKISTMKYIKLPGVDGISPKY